MYAEISEKRKRTLPKADNKVSCLLTSELAKTCRGQKGNLEADYEWNSSEIISRRKLTKQEGYYEKPMKIARKT